MIHIFARETSCWAKSCEVHGATAILMRRWITSHSSAYSYLPSEARRLNQHWTHGATSAPVWCLSTSYWGIIHETFVSWFFWNYHIWQFQFQSLFVGCLLHWHRNQGSYILISYPGIATNLEIRFISMIKSGYFGRNSGGDTDTYVFGR